jgi:hypothetical protein
MSFYFLISGNYFFCCLRLYKKFLHYIAQAAKKPKIPKFFIKYSPFLCLILGRFYSFVKNLKLFYIIYVENIKLPWLIDKNLYWWNYFYFESDLNSTPHIFFVDEIHYLSRARSSARYLYWEAGFVASKKFPFTNYKYLKGLDFKLKIYERCELLTNPSFSLLFASFYKFLYFLTAII